MTESGRLSPTELRGAIDLSALGTPAPKPGGAPSSGHYVIDVDLESFESVVQSSAQYPVIVLLWLPNEQANVQVAKDLSAAIEALDGRALLARADVEAAPQIAGAFQVQGVPTVVALLAGQPIPLFQGAASPDQIKQVLDQVLQAAEANAITGRAPKQDGDDTQEAAAEEPAPEPIPPLHQEAYDALDRGDFDAAVAAFTKASKQDPSDTDAVAGIAQVELLRRTHDSDLHAVRDAAANSPDDIDAQLAVADMDFIGGKVDDALDRLLTLIPSTAGDDKDRLRIRILDYFIILGDSDPRVAPARRRLTTVLY